MRYEAILDIEQKISSRQYSNPCAYLHFHRSIEIHYVIKGKLLVRLEERNISAESGDLLFIPSYCAHSVQSASDTTDEVFIVPYNYFKYLENENIQLHYSLLTKLDVNRTIYEYMLLIKQELDNPNSFLIRGYISVIFGLILKHYEVEKKQYSSKNNLVAKIIQYIEQHYREDIRLETLANEYSFNKYYFSKFFNKMFGCTLRAYINDVRITHILTDESDKLITERILNAGFHDISTFYKYKKTLWKFD